MDIIVVYRDEEFVVYDPSSYDEFKEVCNYLIPSERIWKEWKAQFETSKEDTYYDNMEPNPE